MRQQAFTLIEVLVVLAIIGILASIFSVGIIRSVRTAELREAAAQVATDFRRARSQAQRQSKDIILVLPDTTPRATYRVDAVSKTLDNNILLACTTNCGGTGANVNVTYQAPYAELGSGATGNIFTLTSPMSGITPYEIRIVGVTGKVILTRAGS